MLKLTAPGARLTRRPGERLKSVQSRPTITPARKRSLDLTKSPDSSSGRAHPTEQTGSEVRGACVPTEGPHLHGVPEHLAPLTDPNLLVARIATAQDRAAFVVLFEEYAPRVKAYLMKRGLDPTLAEELAQETLLAVWRKAGQFDPAKAPANTWIFSICRNLMVDALRRERRPSPTDADGCEPPQVTPTDQLVESKQRDRDVRRALRAISSAQRQVVQLSFFEAKTHGEISKELGLPLGTVKSRVRLAFTQLRLLLRVWE